MRADEKWGSCPFKWIIPKNFAAIGLLFSLLFAQASAWANPYHIRLYTGYSNGQKLLIEGRLTQARTQPEASASDSARKEDSARKNLKQNLRHFSNKKGKNWPLLLSIGPFHFQTRTDNKGYFRVDAHIPEGLEAGWHPVFAQSMVPQKNTAPGKSTAPQGHTAAQAPSSHIHPAFGQGHILVVPLENRRGLISDIDDTILISEVLSKRRLLKNTFLKNPAQRQAVPGMAKLYAKLANSNPKPQAAPLFYLSGSPRQLYAPLMQFLGQNHFPRGVLLTKRISMDKASEAWLAQTAYKTKKIQEIFEYLPHVRFILVGDDGEKDPEIYEEIQKRYPHRVEAIWIRRIHPSARRPRFEQHVDLDALLKAESHNTAPETPSSPPG